LLLRAADRHLQPSVRDLTPCGMNLPDDHHHYGCNEREKKRSHRDREFSASK
jgi:hypothetical protein